jgi:hypothetical protein
MSAPASRQSTRPRPPKPRPTAQTLTAAQRRRVEAAASLCADILVDGWQETVADRANTYVTAPTWERLVQGSRRRHCTFLAEIAAAILGLKTKLHEKVGWLVAFIMRMFGAGDIERQFARELAEKIPLPPDAKLVAVARGVQVAGVLLCVANGDDLTRCQCFIDLALNEAKTFVKKLLIAATDDWRGLAQFPPKNWSPASSVEL